MKNIVTTEEARKGFFPTPPKLAEKLLAGIDWDYINSVLEPSAGKGNLVRTVAEKFSRSRRGWRDSMISVDCVELDPWLRSILTYECCGERRREIRARMKQIEDKKRYNHEAGRLEYPSPEDEAEYRELENELKWMRALSCRIVHDDFLTFDSRKRYGLIVMNPPFADGDAHLLKAIELQQKGGGLIRCLLNAETLMNPYTNRRKLLTDKLQKLGATVEYVDGGFSDAERTTDVTVAMISINIPEEKHESVIFERLRKAAELKDTPEANVTDMTVADFMAQIVTRYNVEADAGIELIREYEAMRPYMLQDFDTDAAFGRSTLTLCAGDPSKSMGAGSSPSVNEFLSLVRAKYWSALFRNKEFTGKLTSNLQTKYRNMVDELKDYDFTLFNIQQIAAQMEAEMGKGIQETIVALFDKMTQEHSWYPECSKNIHYYNGWKTNKVHKINSKVILPISGVFSSYGWEKDTFNVRNAESTISDIEKVFDYLDGNQTEPVDLRGVLSLACDGGKTRKIPCKYFYVDLFKKGTMHIKFRNQELVDKFNIYCCRKKNWLPPNYGKASYASMSQEERAVIDGFHGDGTEGAGESAYQAVFLRSDYYLAEPKNELPALAAGT